MSDTICFVCQEECSIFFVNVFRKNYVGNMETTENRGMCRGCSKDFGIDELRKNLSSRCFENHGYMWCEHLTTICVLSYGITVRDEKCEAGRPRPFNKVYYLCKDCMDELI